MRPVSYTPTSALALTLLAEAAEFIHDFEGDMSMDMAGDLKHGDAKHFDETLAEIADMRARVKWAKSFMAAIKSAKIGEALHFDARGLDVLDRGLEFMQDNLAEMVTDPMWEITRKMKDSTVIAFSHAEFTKLREAVEHNIERADLAAELLKDIRGISAAVR